MIKMNILEIMNLIQYTNVCFTILAKYLGDDIRYIVYLVLQRMILPLIFNERVNIVKNSIKQVTIGVS